MAGHPLPSRPQAPSGAAPAHGPAVAVDPALGIGPRLAALRTARGMRVSELARLVGVSPSLISQIERGQSRPSVSTLFGLAQALEMPVDAFFRDPAAGVAGAAVQAAPDAEAGAAPDAGRYVVRRADRATIEIEGGVRWERLTPGALDEVEFLELEYAPGAESHHALYRHPGMEMVLVLSGHLHILIGFERHELGPGDSICFPSSRPHRYHNPSDQTTRAVTVILPDGTPAEPLHDDRRRP